MRKWLLKGTLLTGMLLLAALLAGCGGGSSAAAEPLDRWDICASGTPMPGTNISPNRQYSSPPALGVNPARSYTACFVVAGRGRFEIELFASRAPQTVNNFVFLARDGYYNGISFHRVIKQPDLFMAQGGDPTGTGAGGPGYQFPDEHGALALTHDTPGILSMANAGPNTNGSQFFITFVPTPWLNGVHAVFGRVRGSAMDVVLNIEQGDLIESLTIVEQ